MMKKARKLDMLKGACIGTNNIIVYYLQFADDTIFMGEATRENAWTIKMILRNMELVSGLKINFEKCCTYGVNVSFDRLGKMAEILGCSTRMILFSYLRIKVGVNHREVRNGREWCKKIKLFLGIGMTTKSHWMEEITLLNLVLSSPSIYY